MTIYIPAETPALPCGCVPGVKICPEAEKLTTEVILTHKEAKNAPYSDYAWQRYEQAQVKLYGHFRLELEEVASEPIKETV